MDDWGFVMDVRSDGISDDVRGTIDYAEVALLEFWFEGDAKCESSHWGSPGCCSGAAVARVSSSCGLPSVLWCVARVDEHWDDVAAGGVRCIDCGALVVDCWRVVSV